MKLAALALARDISQSSLRATYMADLISGHGDIRGRGICRHSGMGLDFIRRQTRRVRTQPRAYGRTLVGLTVNIKQANLVLVVALVVSSGMVALRDREIHFSIFLKRRHF